MTSEHDTKAGPIQYIPLTEGRSLRKASEAEPWALHLSKGALDRYLQGEESSLIDAAVAATLPLSNVPGARRVTYVPRRGKKGVFRVTAWGPPDMVLPDHTRIIDDVVLYEARTPIRDASNLPSVDTPEFREALAVYAQNHGQTGEGAARYEVVQEVLEWAAGAIHAPIVARPGDLASEMEAFYAACPEVYTDAERELLWKGWQLRFQAIPVKQEIGE
jgi:hypothetical protein